MHCEACARKVARALKGFQGALLLLLLLLSTDLPLTNWDLILHIDLLFYFCSFHDGSNDKSVFAALIM